MTRATSVRHAALGCALMVAATASGPSLERANDDRTVHDLRRGDCVTNIQPQSRVLVVEIVPCSHPHHIQVLGVIELGLAPYARGALVSRSHQACSEHLRATLPHALEDPKASLAWLEPIRRAWNDGDREITCLLAISDKRSGRYQS